MVDEPDQIALRAQGGAERVVARRTVIVVLDVLAAIPEQLYGLTHLPGDGDGSQHEVVGEPAAPEAPARTGRMHRDLVRVQLEELAYQLQGQRRGLRRRP